MILVVRTTRLSFGILSVHSKNMAEKARSAFYKVGIVRQRRDKQETAMSRRQQPLDQKLYTKNKEKTQYQNHKGQVRNQLIPGVRRVGHRDVTMGKRYSNSDKQASLLQMLPSVSSSWSASAADPPCPHLVSNKAARRCNEATATVTRSVCTK